MLGTGADTVDEMYSVSNYSQIKSFMGSIVRLKAVTLLTEMLS